MEPARGGVQTARLRAAALFADLPTPAGFMEKDLWVMLAASVALAPFVFFKVDIGKAAGIAFLAAYVAYISLALA